MVSPVHKGLRNNIQNAGAERGVDRDLREEHSEQFCEECCVGGHVRVDRHPSSRLSEVVHNGQSSLLNDVVCWGRHIGRGSSASLLHLVAACPSVTGGDWGDAHTYAPAWGVMACITRASENDVDGQVHRVGCEGIKIVSAPSVGGLGGVGDDGCVDGSGDPAEER